MKLGFVGASEMLPELRDQAQLLRALGAYAVFFNDTDSLDMTVRRGDVVLVHDDIVRTQIPDQMIEKWAHNDITVTAVRSLSGVLSTAQSPSGNEVRA